ncbi:PadR family transcriptional regulator [Pigmentibacter sp. JX0631]|uniref:PadR family transcriptional regulator n=1 Tax=Pigmentibacter sp. JX0631 TaxID=2976982 RepID=UPI00246825AA|nr:PadR family transcriptional regulator [Pigmentibacter sp. JX0631]WGL59788.1 PadR family transcriptional regulator [Pigmentibacter sp. JX0631]
MNSQLKKGVLELCVMVILNKKDCYGYELVETLSEHISVVEGTIYPLLRRLLKEGYFETYLQESGEGPSRKYYKLTELGRKTMHEMLQEWREFSQGVNMIIERDNIGNQK